MTITETTFGPKKYLALKKTLAMSELTDKSIYDEAGKTLGAYIGQNGVNVTGPWTVLYFTWDGENKTTDMGIAFPIEGLTEVNDANFMIVDLPETKASKVEMIGSYDQLMQVHGDLAKNREENNLLQEGLSVLFAEEYVAGPMQNPDSTTWITNVYHFHN